MAETLQVIITADNKEAIKAIQDTIKGTEGLKSQFKTLGSASNEANQALINSGRVLQDLNYGFMGIANNLNPLLESYQRLSDKTKENSSIGKELKDALMGPAGIGVALSALTFIILKYGDAIGDLVEKTLIGKNALREEVSAIEASGDGFKKAYLEMSKLGDAFEAFHNGTMTKKEVLDEYNNTLGKVYGNTKDINEAEAIYAKNTENYIEAARLRAAAEYEYKKAAEEAAKAAETRAKPKELSTPIGIGIGVGMTYGQQNYKAVGDAAKYVQTETAKAYDENEKFYNSIAKGFDKQANALIKGGLHTKTYGQNVQDVLRDEDRALQNQIAQLEASIAATEKWANDQMRIHERVRQSAKKAFIIDTRDLVQSPEEKLLANIPDWMLRQMGGKNTASQPIPVSKQPAWITAWEKQSEADDKKLKDKIENYKKFAETLSGQVTSALVGVFDTMARGGDVLESLGNAFLKLAEDIGAAILKEIIFKAILAGINPELAVTEGVGVNPATGDIATGWISKFANIMTGTQSIGAGMDTSGIVTNSANTGGEFTIKGNDLVLALQRSNYSLSLKRGQ